MFKRMTVVIAMFTFMAIAQAQEDHDLKQEYKMAEFVAKELQLVLKEKCKMDIDTQELMKKSPLYKKLITLKALHQPKNVYDKILLDTVCPKDAKASQVRP